ncbi:hypothetical protein HDU76_007915, partial [Blyttiomyces sp. JEL0837]
MHRRRSIHLASLATTTPANGPHAMMNVNSTRSVVSGVSGGVHLSNAVVRSSLRHDCIPSTTVAARYLHSTPASRAPPSLATSSSSSSSSQTTQHQRSADALPAGGPISRMDSLNLPSTKHHLKVNIDTVLDLDMNLRAIVNPPTTAHSHPNAHPRHRPSSLNPSPSTTPSTSNSRHSHPQRPVPSTSTVTSSPLQTQKQQPIKQQETPKPHVHLQHHHQHIHQNHTHALTLEKYASKEINPLSLKQLINAGKAVSLSKLLNGAAFLREELIVRIAHQIR